MIKCPLCEGKGKVYKPDSLKVKDKRELARKMRDLGFTFNVIMRALDYKSPHSVTQALEENI